MNVMETLTAAVQAIFGEGQELAWWQMACRAALAFMATWLLLRIAGRRAFAQKTAFDLCIVLLLGAVLSRAVVGASSMAGTFAASVVLVLLHRAISMVSAVWPAFDRVIGGRPIYVVRNGHEDNEARRRALLSDEDLDASARGRLQAESHDGWNVVLERDGQISFVRAEGGKPHAPLSKEAAAIAAAVRSTR